MNTVQSTICLKTLRRMWKETSRSVAGNKKKFKVSRFKLVKKCLITKKIQTFVLMISPACFTRTPSIYILSDLLLFFF